MAANHVARPQIGKYMAYVHDDATSCHNNRVAHGQHARKKKRSISISRTAASREIFVAQNTHARRQYSNGPRKQLRPPRPRGSFRARSSAFRRW